MWDCLHHVCFSFVVGRCCGCRDGSVVAWMLGQVNQHVICGWWGLVLLVRVS